MNVVRRSTRAHRDMDLTKAVLKKICRDSGLYSSPSLNDKLYLHYKVPGWGICEYVTLVGIIATSSLIGVHVHARVYSLTSYKQYVQALVLNPEILMREHVTSLVWSLFTGGFRAIVLLPYGTTNVHIFFLTGHSANPKPRGVHRLARSLARGQWSL